MKKATSLVLLSVLLVACSGAAPGPDVSAIQTQAAKDAIATLTAQTPAVTSTPTSEAAVTPASEATPTPLPPTPTPPPPPPTPVAELIVLEFSGHGNEATQSFHLDSGLLRCSYTHDGQSNFIVDLLDSQGNPVALLANEIGACEGSSADSIRSAGDYLLSVMGDGNWTFSCEATGPVEQPPPEEPNVILEFSGHGDEATQSFHLDIALLRCSYTHDGQSNFIVDLLDSQGKPVALLANEIGACEGSSAHSIRAAGDYLLDVMGDGNWTITLTQ